MKIKVILFVLLSILFTGIPLYACTIFYVVKDNKIFAGNNEDWENPSSKMWFYPAENNKHGWIKIDLVNELNKGYRSFDIPNLFSRVKLLSPADGEEIESTSVTLTWEGIPGNNYEVILSTDPEFLNNNSKYEVNTNSGLIVHSGFFYFLPGLLLVIPWIRKKRIPYFSMMILLAVLLDSQCTKSEISTPEIQVVEMTKTISNLSPNSTYYWKIRAHAHNQDDFYSETLTRCFNK